MKNLFKKFFSILCIGVILFTGQSMPVYASDNQVEVKELINNIEPTKPIDEESFNNMIEKSVILAEGVEQIELELKDNSINPNYRAASRKAYIVDVSWRVGYNAVDGLCFYTSATSRDPRCGIIALRGMNRYKDLNSAASGAMAINTRGSSAIKMHNFCATNRFFKTGTVLKCDIDLDVDATYEVSGGAFSRTINVTIPKI